MTRHTRRGPGAGALSGLAVLLALAGTMHSVAVLADGPGKGLVTWGHEESGGHLTLEVPFTTPDRERIEVVSAYEYADPRLGAREAMMRTWRASLPETVDVLRVPLVWIREENDPRAWRQRREHRRVLLGARLLGVADDVHAALLKTLGRAPHRLPGEFQVQRFLTGHGIDVRVYEAAIDSPAFHGAWWEGSTLGAGLQTAEEETENNGGVPWLLINGRHVTSSLHAGSAASAFRVANRLIRETMESGPPYHKGPTSIPELIEMLEMWPGIHLTNIRSGRFRGVYNPWRRELWSLDEAGDVRAVARETDGEDAFWQWRDTGGNETSFAMNWRAGFYYSPREPRVRHGAFQFADWLSGGQVVELSFKQRPTGLSFAPDGRVEAQSAQGPVRGSWWLEAASLHVSLGAYGIGSWPWRDAASQAGFEAPSESVRPWSPEMTEFAMHGDRVASRPRGPELTQVTMHGDRAAK